MASAAVDPDLRLEVKEDQVKFSYQEDNYTRTNVTIVRKREKNKLQCRHCSKDWCRHIEFILKENLDYPLIGPPDVEWEGLHVSVPVMPQHSLWATVAITEYHEATHAYKVALAMPDGSLMFLGFFHRGEGRLTMTTMVLDWFKVWFKIEDHECLISAHGFKEQMRMEKEMHSGFEGWLRHAWSLFDHNQCYNCTKAMSDLDDVSVF